MPLSSIDLESAAKQTAEATIVVGSAWGAIRLALGFGPWVDRRIDARVAPALAAITVAAERQMRAADRQAHVMQEISADVVAVMRALGRVEGVLSGDPPCAGRRKHAE